MRKAGVFRKEFPLTRRRGDAEDAEQRALECGGKAQRRHRFGREGAGPPKARRAGLFQKAKAASLPPHSKAREARAEGPPTLARPKSRAVLRPLECGGKAQRRHRFVPGEERGRPYILLLGGSLLPQKAN